MGTLLTLETHACYSLPSAPPQQSIPIGPNGFDRDFDGEVDRGNAAYAQPSPHFRKTGAPPMLLWVYTGIDTPVSNRAASTPR